MYTIHKFTASSITGLFFDRSGFQELSYVLSWLSFLTSSNSYIKKKTK